MEYKVVIGMVHHGWKDMNENEYLYKTREAK